VTTAVAAVEPRGARRGWRHLLAEAVVSPRSSDPPRRRPADMGVLAASLVLLAVTAVRARPTSGPEVDLAVFLNGLPQGLAGAVLVALRFGSLWVVAVVAGLGARAHRRVLSVQLLIAGVLAWSSGRALAAWYGERRPPPGISVHSGDLQQYPLVRIAVAVAVVAAAAPYLTRLARRFTTALITVMAVAAVSLGVGLPTDVVAGLLLGWASAAVVRLLFGSPAGRPSLDQLAEALAEIRADASALHFAPTQEPGSTRVLARAGDGVDLCIRAYGRDERDAQLLSKLWRFIWYEDSGPTLYVTRLQEVEHQAYAMLLATQAGAAVPQVVAATSAGPATAILVERRPRGALLSDLDPTQLTDDTLHAAWRTAVGLRRARVAHGALDLTKLFLTEAGDVLAVDFSVAATAVTDALLDADAAKLLAATSVAVGPERAVAAAHAALGDAGLVTALPYLQPPVLTDSVRRALRRHRGALGELRAAAAAAVGSEPPTLVQLERVRPRSLALALSTFVGVYALFGQLGNVSLLTDELRHAAWGWVAVAALLSAATNVGYAIAYVGATTARVPFGRTVELQAAGSFTNLIAPNGFGTAAINARFLQLRGVPLPAAVGSLFVNTIGSALAQLALFAAMVPVASTRLDLSLIPWGSLLVGVTAVGAVAAVAGAVVWRLPRVRRSIAQRARPALDQLLGVLRSPAKLALILGGQLLVQLLFAATLGAACLAFGATVPLSTLLLVNIASSTLSGLVPAPGGLGVAEATLAAALTATGIDSPTAIAATLTHRFVTTWLPSVPGWLALRALERGDDL
jgi:uncharacterized membrane protein YbhN (UPF0104 family)